MFCPKCGKEIDNNSQFCQFCGFELLKTTKTKTKKQDFDPENIPTTYAKNNDALSGCGCLIFIVIALFLIISGCNKEDENTQPQEQYSAQEKQELIVKTNKFVNMAQKEGVLKKINKQCVYDSDDCIFEFWVNENLWAQMPYEDKQSAFQLFKKYTELRNKTNATVVKSFYSGKTLADAWGVK